jgi:hypothetical protein
MISSQTRANIKGFLEGFINGMVEEFKASDISPKALRPPRTKSSDGNIKPFHEAILPEGILRITEFERSFSTKLGTTFEEVAKTIGTTRYKKAERGFHVSGPVSAEAVGAIEAIANRLNKGSTRTWPQLIGEVIASSKGPGETRTRIADLYLLDSKGNELFFEMKSPKPNKGQCIEATDRLLQIHAIRRAGPPRVRTFYAMAYNPYGRDRKNYKHSFTMRYMDTENQVLIGSEFWEIVGGPGTYEDVLDIYREVGREKGPDMIDQLALGY